MSNKDCQWRAPEYCIKCRSVDKYHHPILFTSYSRCGIYKSSGFFFIQEYKSSVDLYVVYISYPS